MDCHEELLLEQCQQLSFGLSRRDNNGTSMVTETRAGVLPER